MPPERPSSSIGTTCVGRGRARAAPRARSARRIAPVVRQLGPEQLERDPLAARRPAPRRRARRRPRRAAPRAVAADDRPARELAHGLDYPPAMTRASACSGRSRRWSTESPLRSRAASRGRCSPACCSTPGRVVSVDDARRRALGRRRPRARRRSSRSTSRSCARRSARTRSRRGRPATACRRRAPTSRASSSSPRPRGARRTPRARAELLREALALWRGPALAEFRDEPFAEAAERRARRAAPARDSRSGSTPSSSSASTRGSSPSSRRWSGRSRCASGRGAS